MANDILQEMERQISSMTSAQRKVAEYILQDSMEAAFSTIDKIAHSTGVSTTSVIRLANSLGYTTFSEFQKALKDYMRTHSAPINKLSLNVQDDMTLENGVTADVYRYAAENVGSAVQGLNQEVLESIAKQLDEAEHIYICGVRTSESVARYLTFNLNRMYLNTYYVGESLTEQLDLFKRIGKKDVLIAVTLSRYNKVVCDAAALCKKEGIPVIALTDSYDSPLIPFSTYQLIGKCQSNAFHNSIIAQVFLCDALIKVCSLKSADRVRENLKKDEQLQAEFKFFVRK